MSNGAQALSEMIQTALARPDDMRAVQHRKQWYDWGWMRRTAERVNTLLDEAGVGPNDAVAIAPGNRPACAAALLALLGRTRDVVMIYAYQSPEAIARKLPDLNCAAILLQPEAWAEPTLRAANEMGALGISLGEDAVELVPGTRLDTAAEHRRAAPETGVHMLTSGTTGPPKLRHLTYDFIWRSMLVDTPVHPLGAPPPPKPTPHGAAFGNIAGLYSYLPLVASGRMVIMTEKFNLDDFLDYVREWQPESGGMPPSAFREMMDRDIPAEALASIKYMSGGACAFDADLLRAVEAKYEVKILQAYGATEFGGVVSQVLPQHFEEYGPEKSLSVGRPWAGAEFRIVDPETGQDLPAGEGGQLHVRVPRLGPEWVATSDLCKLDEDGFLYYLGRSDGAIVRGGFKVDPEQIRAALLAHPAISDALVAGAPDRRLGEVPVAAYVLRQGAAAPSADELKAHLRARLPATFVPTGYRQVPAIPLTPTNKPDLGAVRAMFAEASEPTGAKGA